MSKTTKVLLGSQVHRPSFESGIFSRQAKINSCLSMSWNHIVGPEVQFHSFLTSALDGNITTRPLSAPQITRTPIEQKFG